jgi:hypothetical protein
MGSRKLYANVTVGLGMALAVAVPTALGRAPVTHRPAVTSHTTQALTALDARWNAEAAAYKATQVQLAAARAVIALDARWNAEAAAFKATHVQLDAARALNALDARWNAEAAYFGAR